MSKIDFLKDQIIETRNFTNRLISELPENLWYTIPENTDSNFAWQIGHLMVSQNFHSISVITGKNEKLFELIPMARYSRMFYGMGALHRSITKDLIQTSILKEQFDTVHAICLETLSKLSDDNLNEKLEPAPIKHPIAVTKYDALSWSFKHEMWHCAEMESIKLALGHPIIWL
jgi:hypothetical protein